MKNKKKSDEQVMEELSEGIKPLKDQKIKKNKPLTYTLEEQLKKFFKEVKNG